eukprot:TRINITY_DN26684_c0_g1_i1.p1 TRINITY_DN26684_c0_g1~~TRINITY_DN26684_c0_g1_i1.p1  ORF type:complete len:541 (+),score=99.30 TRINITY_DN26684_c0_g1_i1:60-1682(+)
MLTSIYRSGAKCSSFHARNYSYAAVLPKSATSYTSKLRRLREKKDFEVAEDPDARFFSPHERLGNYYSVNWKLASYAVPPSGDAFHNLNLRHLLMHSKGSIDANKALLSPPATAAYPAHYHVNTGPKVEKSGEWKSMEYSEWVALFSSATKHLAEGANVYVTDGSVGSHRYANGTVRIISSDPNASLFLKHTLSKVSGDIFSFRHQFTVLHAPDFVPNDAKSESGAVFFLLEGSEAIKKHPVNSIFELTQQEIDMAPTTEGAVMILYGQISNLSLKSVMTTMADYIHLREGSLPLEASLVADGKGKSSLVFDPTGVLLENRVSSDLFACGNVVLRDNTVYRAFDGVTHKNTKAARSRGDVVDTVAGTQFVTQPLERFSAVAQGLHAPKPESIVFVVRDPTGVVPPFGRIKSSAALALWKAGWDGKEQRAPFYANRQGFAKQLGELAGRFEKFLEEAKPAVYVINTQGKEGSLTTQDVDNIIKSTLDGSAKNAAVSPVKGLEIGAISKVEKVATEALNPYKGWKDKEAHHAATAPLSKLFS